MAERPLIIGSELGPEPPYPLRMGGKVVSGFGRGSKELGIPTANIPVPTAESSWITTATTGVYFGWASIHLPPSHPTLSPSPTTLSSSKILDDSFTPPTCPLSIPAAKHDAGWRIYPMVMSIGYNPFYKNTVRSAEVHVLHGFEKDFYDAEMRLLIVGFIRDERDYQSLEALVEDIKIDCEVAGRSLGRDNWVPGERDGAWLVGEGNANGEE